MISLALFCRRGSRGIEDGDESVNGCDLRYAFKVGLGDTEEFERGSGVVTTSLNLDQVEELPELVGRAGEELPGLFEGLDCGFVVAEFEGLVAEGFINGSAFHPVGSFDEFPGSFDGVAPF